MSPRRGEVWLVDFDPPVAREQGYVHPAVIASSDDLNGGPSGVVIVVPTTSTPRGLATHIELEVGDTGLDATSYAKAEDVKSLSTARLLHKLGTVPIQVMYEIDQALRVVMELG